jgi:ferrous iron transport protein B
MIDVAAARGMTLNPDALARGLGVPVVSLVASKNEGVAALKAAMTTLIEGLEVRQTVRKVA